MAIICLRLLILSQEDLNFSKKFSSPAILSYKDIILSKIKNHSNHFTSLSANAIEVLTLLLKQVEFLPQCVSFISQKFFFLSLP